MNRSYKYTCPVCGRKYDTRQQAMDCADLDCKEKPSYVTTHDLRDIDQDREERIKTK